MIKTLLSRQHHIFCVFYELICVVKFNFRYHRLQVLFIIDIEGLYITDIVAFGTVLAGWCPLPSIAIRSAIAPGSLCHEAEMSLLVVAFTLERTRTSARRRSHAAVILLGLRTARVVSHITGKDDKKAVYLFCACRGRRTYIIGSIDRSMHGDS